MPRLEHHDTHQRPLDNGHGVLQVHKRRGKKYELQRVRRSPISEGQQHVDQIKQRHCNRQREPCPREPHEGFSRQAWSPALIEPREITRQIVVQNEQAHPKPHQAHHLIEPRGGSRFGLDLGVVDASKSVDLHHPVPPAPQERKQDDDVQIKVGEPGRYRYKKQRRNDQANSKAAEERAVPVGSQHSRKVMSHRQRKSNRYEAIYAAGAARDHKR